LADPSEPRGGVLSRTRSWLAAAAACALSAAAAWVWFFPGSAATRFAPWLARRAGGTLEYASVEGTLSTGVIVRDLRWSTNGVDIRVPLLRFRLGWSRLLSRTLELDPLELFGPEVRVRAPASQSAPAPAVAAAAPAAWGLSVPRLLVHDGSLEWTSPGGTPPVRRIEGVQANVGWDGGRAIVRSLHARTQGFSLEARGSAAMRPRTADIRLHLEGPVRLDARVRSVEERWSAEGGGVWRGAPFRGGFTVEEPSAPDGLRRWTVRVDFDRAAPRRFWPTAPAWLSPIEGRITATGRGVGRDARADGTWRLRMDKLQASGRAALDNGRVSADGRASGAGAAIAFAGDGSIYSRAGRLAWSASLSPSAVREWTGATARMETTGEARGTWPDVSWRGRASFSDVTQGGLRIASGTVTASGTLGPDARLEAAASAFGVQAGSASIRELKLAVQGSTASHHIDASVDSAMLTARLSGVGRLQAPYWTVHWSDAEATLGGVVWRSTAPFTSEARKDLLHIAGLHLTDGKATADFDGEKTGDRWTHFRLAVRDLDPATLAGAGIAKVPISGLWDVDLAFSGTPREPEGGVSFRIRGASYDGLLLGSASGRGRLEKDRLQIVSLEWEAPGGFAQAAGTAPLFPASGRTPDFDFRVRTKDLDLSFLAPRFPSIRLEAPHLDADFEIASSSGVLSTVGEGRLTALSAAPPGGALRLVRLDAELVGEKDRIRIKEARADGIEGGNVRASGVLSFRGPEVKAEARGLRFSMPGLAGVLDASMQFKGDWPSVVYSGEVRVKRADFDPEAWVDAKPGPASEPGSSSGRLALRWDRNVWLKQGTSAIETRGELSLEKEPLEEAQLFGTIEAIRGSYVFYGRSFEIQTGRLLFSGETPSDPALQATAQYTERESDTKVNIDFTGTARRPVLKLNSEPAMEERDILSVLLIGRPMEPVAGENQTASDRAAVAQQMAADYISRGVRQSLLKRLDLDILNVKVGSNPELSLGRYLMPNLFISYGQTLGPAGEKRVQAQYNLSRHWDLEGRTNSLGKYIIDLMFKYGIK
jgi:autotransporter translocation and assembly factor TamB